MLGVAWSKPTSQTTAESLMASKSLWKYVILFCITPVNASLQIFLKDLLILVVSYQAMPIELAVLFLDLTSQPPLYMVS